MTLISVSTTKKAGRLSAPSVVASVDASPMLSLTNRVRRSDEGRKGAASSCPISSRRLLTPRLSAVW